MVNQTKRVVIWGADNHHALGVVRSLAEGDFEVTFLVNGKRHNVATASKYCTKYVLQPGLNEGLEWLLANSNPENKAVIIPMGDAPAELMDQHREELLKGYYVSGTTEPGLLTKVDDKKTMAEIAKRHGFDVPATMEITWESKIDKLPEGVTYPCLIKPSVTTGFAEFKTRILKNKSELDSAISLFGHSNKYLLQQLIQKENDLLVYGVRLNSGKVLLAGTFIKDRWSDDGGGSHGWLVPDVMENCNPKGIESMLEEIDYHGLFSFEYGLQDGTAWFYEVNLRNDATGGVFFCTKSNLPLAWVVDCFGGNAEDIPTKVEGKHFAMHEFLDQVNISRGKVSKEEWKRQREEATAFYYYDKDDMRPYEIAARKAWFDRQLRAILLRWRPQITYILRKLKIKK